VDLRGSRFGRRPSIANPKSLRYAARPLGGSHVCLAPESQRCSVVPWICGRGVGSRVNANPLGVVDPPALLGAGGPRKGACHPYPTARRGRDVTDVGGGLSEILILAEYDGYIEHVEQRETYDVECDAHIDPLFPPDASHPQGAVCKLNLLVVVPKLAGADVDAPATHHGQLVRPKAVPVGIDLSGRDARVESSPRQTPGPGSADRVGQRQGVIVRIRCAEHLARRVKEVLAINERDGTFDRRFSRHVRGPRKQYPAGGLAACPAGRKCFDYP
jgi:hypothetical protein